MEDRETARMRKYGESKTTRIMMETVPHVTSGSGLKEISDRWIFVRQSVRRYITSTMHYSMLHTYHFEFCSFDVQLFKILCSV